MLSFFMIVFLDFIKLKLWPRSDVLYINVLYKYVEFYVWGMNIKRDIIDF